MVGCLNRMDGWGYMDVFLSDILRGNEEGEGGGYFVVLGGFLWGFLEGGS